MSRVDDLTSAVETYLASQSFDRALPVDVDQSPERDHEIDPSEFIVRVDSRASSLITRDTRQHDYTLQVWVRYPDENVAIQLAEQVETALFGVVQASMSWLGSEIEYPEPEDVVAVGLVTAVYRDYQGG